MPNFSITVRYSNQVQGNYTLALTVTLNVPVYDLNKALQI